MKRKYNNSNNVNYPITNVATIGASYAARLEPDVPPVVGTTMKQFVLEESAVLSHQSDDILAFSGFAKLSRILCEPTPVK